MHSNTAYVTSTLSTDNLSICRASNTNLINHQDKHIQSPPKTLININKTLLLPGGMTPDVTTLYYRTINTVAPTRLGARHSAPLYIFSPEVKSMVQHITRGDWTSFAQANVDPIETLVVGPTKAKVDRVVVCPILAHKVAKQVKKALNATGVPFLHVVDLLARHVETELPEV
jgi:aspartate racemase